MSVALVMLGLTAACFFFRMLRGPSIADRIVAFDGLIVIGAAAIAVDAVRRDSVTFLPVIVVLALVGFVSTAVAARFVAGRDT